MTNLPKIYGFNKTSEMGVNLFAPCIFLGGCNLKCKYCMNYKLINPIDLNEVSMDIIKQYVLENKCEWINISGGEPTCTNFERLSNLISELTSWGCKVGMSTNGTMPDTLRRILPHLNYVALDIKSSKHSVYDSISTHSNLTNVFISHSILMSEKNNRPSFDFEVRTTLFPQYIDLKDLQELSHLIRKGDKWVLQQFRNNVPMLDGKSAEVVPYSESFIQNFIKGNKNIHLRYV